VRVIASQESGEEGLLPVNRREPRGLARSSTFVSRFAVKKHFPCEWTSRPLNFLVGGDMNTFDASCHKAVMKSNIGGSTRCFCRVMAKSVIVGVKRGLCKTEIANSSNWRIDVYCKTGFANLADSRIRVYCTNGSANFARLANLPTNWPIRRFFMKLVILVIIVFGVLVDSYWFDLRLGIPIGVTES
jgi:hypothetical protein